MTIEPLVANRLISLDKGEGAAINTHRQPAQLFVTDGKEIVSAEGPIQGDPLAMCLYALSI